MSLKWGQYELVPKGNFSRVSSHCGTAGSVLHFGEEREISLYEYYATIGTSHHIAGAERQLNMFHWMFEATLDIWANAHSYLQFTLQSPNDLIMLKFSDVFTERHLIKDHSVVINDKKVDLTNFYLCADFNPTGIEEDCQNLMEVIIALHDINQ